MNHASPFRIRKLRKKSRRTSALLFAAAAIVIFSVMFELGSAQSGNVIDPLNEESGKVFTKPSGLTIPSRNTPSLNPPVSTISPTFNGANFTGPIFGQKTGDTGSDSTPIEVFDQINVWGDINALGRIENTQTGTVIVNDTLDIKGNTAITGNLTTIGQFNLFDASGELHFNAPRIKLEGIVDNPAGDLVLNDNLDVRGSIFNSTGKLILNDTLELNAAGSRFVVQSTTGQSELVVKNATDANGWDIGTNWTSNPYGGADALYFFNERPGSIPAGYTRMGLDKDGNLKVAGNISAGSTGTVDATALNATGAITGNAITGNSIGRFYQRSANTTRLTQSNFAIVQASCDAGDIAVSCTGLQDGSAGRYMGAVPSPTACIAKTYYAGASGTLIGGASPGNSLFSYVNCFSPNG